MKRTGKTIDVCEIVFNKKSDPEPRKDLRWSYKKEYVQYKVPNLQSMD